ncbi:hypothetical protein [Yoonia sp. MH D7]
MKVFLIACVAIVAIAFLAGNVLNGVFQQDSATAFATEGARVPDAKQDTIRN